MVPRQHTDCTNEIPVTFNDTEVFVDPISLVIKTAAAPVRCNDIAPPRWYDRDDIPLLLDGKK